MTASVDKLRKRRFTQHVARIAIRQHGNDKFGIFGGLRWVGGESHLVYQMPHSRRSIKDAKLCPCCNKLLAIGEPFVLNR